MSPENTNESKQPLVIYHGNCLDGFTAAWVFWTKHKDWEFYAAKHGNPPPDNIDGRIVYMVDFSYKRPVILEMASKANRIFIIDHHKTAEADLVDLPENVYVTFDMNHSGARLAWDFLYKYTDDELYHSRPILVDYVEDRDLWTFKLPETKAINEYLFGQSYDFSNWNLINKALNDEEYREDIINIGYALLNKQAKMTEELCKNKFRYNIDNHEVWIVNLPYNYSSDAGNLLCQGEPFAATYYYDGEGYVFSLRSDENGLDVSEVAKKYGGGGHKHAAGFKLKSPMLIFDPKKLGIGE